MSRLFCTLAYERTKVRLLKMLHTRTHKSRMAVKNERLMSGYTECTGCKHERLCGICPYRDGQSGTKMAERMSAAIGQENTTRSSERNAEQK